MIIYKCKMCGGSLNVSEGSKIATCEYCQTPQTIPSTDDEKRANLFNRANHFRQNSEFDKAMGIYEHILAEDSSDAEAYWSIVLCKYGIEYVEDPVTKIQKPTVNRTRAQSILQDADYLMALEHADYTQKELYEKEAEEIGQIQKDILYIAQNESPYDIFISYKEKSPNGERTRSSVLAQDIYNHLTKEGYRVFFSRVSLEDKVGEKYEPYIYSALNSAKVMLVVGTQKDEFSAPWVRNEWSRFLAMMREDTGKLLIPCFKDLDIDDLPDEFQILQCQDMSKIGFEQDLLHGIAKVINNNVNKIEKTTQGLNTDPSLERLLKNAETYKKLHNFEAAYSAYQNVTRLYPEDYRGWWGMIQFATKGFTLTDYENVRTDTLNKWFGYVKELAPEAAYKDMLEQYTQFWEAVSKTQAAEEIKSVEKIIKNHQSEIDALNKKVSDIEDEAGDNERTYKQRDNELQSTIDVYTNKCYALKQEIERILNKRKRAWRFLKISALLFLIPYSIIVVRYILAIDEMVLEDYIKPVLAIAIAVGLISLIYICPFLFIITGRKKRKIPDMNIQMGQLRDTVSKHEQERIMNQKNYEKEMQETDDKKRSYNASIEEWNQKILDCRRYIDHGGKEISRLLFALDCEKIGVAKDCDSGLLNLRNNVLGISNGSNVTVI